MKKSTLQKALALIATPLLALSISSCSSTVKQESTGQYVDSSAITLKVKSALLADKTVKSLPITVKTFKNTVQLSGFVDNKYQETRAVEIARSVPGVNDVQDSLIVKKHHRHHHKATATTTTAQHS